MFRGVLLDLATGKEVEDADLIKRNVRWIGFFPTGKKKLCSDRGRGFVWDADTGKSVWLEGDRFRSAQVRLTHDGKFIVDDASRTWDSATGKLVAERDFKQHPGVLPWMNYLGVDGYLVYATGAAARGDRGPREDVETLWRVHLWDFTKWRYVGQVGRDTHSMEPGRNAKPFNPTPPLSKVHGAGAIGDGCFAVRISPSGKPMLFTRLPLGALEALPQKKEKTEPDAMQSYENAILVCDRATGEHLHRFAEADLDPLSGIISADNSTLVAVAPIEKKKGEFLKGGGWIGKTQLLVWDVSAIRKHAARERPDLPVADWNAYYEKMGDPAPLTAFKAMRRLAASPKQTLPLLKERLKPVVAEKVDFARLVAQLDGPFAERTKAQAALIAGSDDALPFLEKALKGDQPLEARRRTEAIVKEIKDSPYPEAGTRRLLWTIEMLEFLAKEPPTSKHQSEKQIRAQVQQLLERLAEGTPTAWVTLEARATLARLKK